ncbi:MAG TPA: efflux RND transporter periplasmic adaptor subunit [Pyrinomonadaceae bacterium]|jgi:RND family efflux transporter MFP subunit
MFNSFRFRRNFSGAALSALFITTIFLTACGGRKTEVNVNADSRTPAGGQAVETTVAQAISRKVPSYLQGTGNLVADEQSDVAPQTSGQIVATLVDVGAFVGQGDPVARLNDRDAQLRLEQAQAGVNQAEAALRQAQVRLGLSPGDRFEPTSVPEVRAAQRTVEASQAQEETLAAQIKNAEAQARLADDTLRRFTRLLETGDESRLTYNQYRTQAEQAREQVNAVRSQLNEARARTSNARQQYEVAINNARGNNQTIATAQASLQNARAELGLAQKAVSDTIIRAPFAGSITERPVAAGEYVTPSSRIVTLVRTNPIKVNLQLPEAESGRVGVGQGVTLSVAAFPDRQFGGKITAINPSLDAEARSVVVEAQIENPDNALRPNMFATARIVQPGGGLSVFVPASAILRDEATNTATVYVIADGKAQARAVQTGTEENDLIQIVSGVDEGETVATSNVARIFDGGSVIVR